MEEKGYTAEMEDALDQNAELLAEVVLDVTCFPVRNPDDSIEDGHRFRISEDMAVAIRGALGGMLLIDENGRQINLDKPWRIVLGMTDRALTMTFVGGDGTPIIPVHKAGIQSVKKEMRQYLDCLEFDADSNNTAGYLYSRDYDRQRQHTDTGIKLLDLFRVEKVLENIEVTCPVIKSLTQYISVREYMGREHKRRRFIVNESTFPRAIYEFAEFAIAGYDQPFRAEMKRRARGHYQPD